jgi:hypothetical protein
VIPSGSGGKYCAAANAANDTAVTAVEKNTRIIKNYNKEMLNSLKPLEDYGAYAYL